MILGKFLLRFFCHKYSLYTHLGGLVELNLNLGWYFSLSDIKRNKQPRGKTTGNRKLTEDYPDQSLFPTELKA